VGHRIPWLTTLPERPLCGLEDWHGLAERRRRRPEQDDPGPIPLTVPAIGLARRMIEYNVSINQKMASVFNALRKIPIIEKYATVSIYAHIERVQA
jgi:hypothetical protein